MHLFGYDVGVDVSSPRYFVWKIQKLVFWALLGGIPLSIAITMTWWIADSVMLKFITTVVYLVAYIILSLIFKASAANAIAELNQIVGKGAMLPNTKELFEADVNEDKSFVVIAGKLNMVAVFVPLVFFLVLLWIFAIFTTGFQLKILSFILGYSFYWYLGYTLSKMSEKAANDDFQLSVRGAVEKLFNMDTLTQN